MTVPSSREIHRATDSQLLVWARTITHAETWRLIAAEGKKRGLTMPEPPIGQPEPPIGQPEPPIGHSPRRRLTTEGAFEVSEGSITGAIDMPEPPIGKPDSPNTTGE